MKSYMIMKRNNGGYKIVEKKYLTTIAKAETYAEAQEKLKEIKLQDKAHAEAKKEAKAKTETEVKTFPLTGKLNGKKYNLIPNNGLELRSRNCYTLYVNGECIFTSGTIEQAIQYLR